ncbi:hypothetical protein [Roseinatronobacter alkalisoli]|uniref:Uncharacterized protein n=1 Tax=Roseinatronobacter alkalisoli TaxID=3028235 RepID=A0ABT5TDJ3_9RHOB|nr:hypothetical protein [Roseinatronobacter sp. HJB301]MDD7973198.1 hypothetical protein [Roseinatronobacter sp. HJB301]
MLKSPEAARAAARIAAENRFGPDANLADPAVAAWAENYAANWTEGVRRSREGLTEIMQEENAWSCREFVYASYLDARLDAASVIRVLRAMRGASLEEDDHAA